MGMRNWELQVQFRVTGSTKDLFGDGFAIWYSRDRMEPGPVFGSRDYFSGLAIIADTYSNHNGPHNVSAYCPLSNAPLSLHVPLVIHRTLLSHERILDFKEYVAVPRVSCKLQIIYEL